MVNRTTLVERLRRLKRWIRNDPSVRAIYDLDGDGEISGEEWDLARQKVISSNVLHLKSVEDFIKCLLAILFGLFFILFCFGYYPFPRIPHQWWHTLLFYILIWGLTAAAAKNLRGGIQSTQPLGMMNIIPVMMGFGFFIAGAVLGEVFYFAGTFGMGFALIPIRPLLLCNQTHLLKKT